MDWISVKDRLPEERVRVLTIDISKEVSEYRLDYLIEFKNENEPYLWACRLVDEWNRVSHWMSLPEPPKDENEMA